jgi:hypothetical protein
MLIWDHDLIMPFDDLFESQEQPLEVSVIQTRNKEPPDSKDTNATRASQSKLNPNHLKMSFALGKNPISIHTQDSPKLDYNVVEYLKKLKANILVMDICRIPQQKDFLLQDLNSAENSTTGNGPEKNLTHADPVGKPTVNTCLGDRKEKPFVPPFLLMFEVLNRNLHNCLVDSRASSNVMPLSVYKKLNAIPLKKDKHVIQLDMT